MFNLNFHSLSKETVAESDSESEDEGIGLTFGGKARHDLMMSDEKVRKLKCLLGKIYLSKEQRISKLT